MKRAFFILISIFSCTLTTTAAVTDTITTKSGLKYLQTKAGNNKKAAKGDKIKVHYKCILPDGTITEETTGGSPFEFTLGIQEVIPGWDEGFLLLSEKETGTFFIPANLAYGKGGVKNEENPDKYDIPPNTALTFEVKLVKVR